MPRYNYVVRKLFSAFVVCARRIAASSLDGRHGHLDPPTLPANLRTTYRKMRQIASHSVLVQATLNTATIVIGTYAQGVPGR